MVVGAIVGAAGLEPIIHAIESGKDIALANKETLVMAGELVIKKAFEKKVKILPIDSEHSAIFQCLLGHERDKLDKIFLTASGGPFLNKPLQEFEFIKPSEAINHPKWNMGKKISIDSATLMNKWLEIIEAKYLFNLENSQIDVLVHPESIVHSMVGYKDGSIIAQLGIPDMTTAISYALSFPNRLELNQEFPDFAALKSLNFYKPDLDKFSCLKIAIDALKSSQTYPLITTVLNASNEIAVEAFLEEKIKFTQIPSVINKTIDKYIANQDLSSIKSIDNVQEIMQIDKWARDISNYLIKTIN